MRTSAALVLFALLPHTQAARKLARKSNKRDVLPPHSAQQAGLAKLEEQEAMEAIATASDPDPRAPAACIASSALLSAVQRVVNGVLDRALTGRDPANFSFRAKKNDIDLYLCKVGLDIDASVEVQGFANAGIEELTCLREKCVEPVGQFRCAKKELTFSGKVRFANVLDISGEKYADWTLCGLEGDARNISLGFQSVDSGINLEFVVTREGLKVRDRTTKIKTIESFETSWGRLQNFRCGWSSLPEFIGSEVAEQLESWCMSTIRFVAERVQTRLEGIVTRQLLRLINRIVDVPANVD